MTIVNHCPDCGWPLVIQKDSEGEVVLGCAQNCGYVEPLPPDMALRLAGASELPFRFLE